MDTNASMITPDMYGSEKATIQALQDRIKDLQQDMEQQRQQSQFVQMQLQQQQTQQQLVYLTTQLQMMRNAQMTPMYTNPGVVGPQPVVQGCTELARDDLRYLYAPLSQFGRCPPGYTDTGCGTSTSTSLRELACKRPRQLSQCTEKAPDETRFRYTTKSNGRCPSGYVDTRCDTSPSEILQRLACKQLKLADSINGSSPLTVPTVAEPVVTETKDKKKDKEKKRKDKKKDKKSGKKGKSNAPTPVPAGPAAAPVGPAPPGPAPVGPVLPLDLKSAVWNMTQKPTPSIQLQGDALVFPIKRGLVGSPSGASFKANPNKMLPSDRATLKYQVYFPPDFDWVKGGKLPGLCLSNDGKTCSTGSEWSTKSGSARVMWREEGRGIGYLYLPLVNKGNTAGNQAMQNQPAPFKNAVQLNRENKSGLEVWHKKPDPHQFNKGAWNDVSLTVILNTPGQANGIFELTINGKTKKETLLYRTDGSVKINLVNFVTFFGGSGKEWASKKDTVIHFKNIQLST